MRSFCTCTLSHHNILCFLRLVFRNSNTAMEWAQRNKYFRILSKGVEEDGWKFVLLARFSPIPSYIINYALAATRVGFILDFLLPTVIGCIPMILQNTSIGSLAGAAVASASRSQKSQIQSYIFPLLGILSSILISLRIKKYASNISDALSNPTEDTGNSTAESSSKTLSGGEGRKGQKRSDWYIFALIKHLYEVAFSESKEYFLGFFAEDRYVVA